MSRISVWRNQCPVKVKVRQDEILNGLPMFLLRELGPAGFVVQEGNGNKAVQVSKFWSVQTGSYHCCAIVREREQYKGI